MKRIFKNIIKVGISVSVIGSIFLLSMNPSNINAKSNNKEQADLRFIFTTDLHGQLNSKDYETGLDYGIGGLARAYDLIMQARNELPGNNSFTFDVGDVMYDYTTEYIFAEDQNEIQPIYKAMALVGYDAITLGNHEFDYGYSNILRQLKGSGLMDKTIVSNVVDSKTEEHPFLENMLITRTVKTTSGKKAEVTIGVIGETIPHLNGKTDNFTGVLKTEDIVINVEKQAKKLKEQGADIIVVLAHSGIGEENPPLNFKNVSYALTKIDEVDMILCGHEHRNFPTTDKTSPYLSLPGVDKNTFLVNGKNLVMANDRGRSIGLVDIKVDVSGDEVKIVNRESSLRYVSDYKTTENEEMKNLYGTWETEFLKYANEIIGELGKGEKLSNFSGILEDTAAIQLINDAKRSHALRYINTQAKQYKDYPVVTVSSYYSYGVKSPSDYINISDKFTESDLAIIQPYNNYLYLYTITGAQLKEWLEWSASAFETTNGTAKWKNKTMSELMASSGLQSLIKEEWSTNWNNFYIFDGVDYTINPSYEPRYDFSGNKINNSKRVYNITYNGKEVTNDTKLIIASNKITGPTEANKGIETQYIYKNFYRTQSILSEYIKTISKTGSIIPTPDNNWKLSLTNKEFLIMLPSIGDEDAKKSPWYVSNLKSENDYTYYKAKQIVESTDKTPPNLYVIPTVTEATGTGYDVVVDGIDASGIKTIRYVSGDHGLDYDSWYIQPELKGKSFKANYNGTYSVFAEDNNGNKIVKKIVIDNISDQVIAAPKVETYTNRKTAIKGSAEANTRIVISASTGTYETKILNDGTFSYSLPAQPSGSKVTIYAKDEESGRQSKKVTVTVKRTGPNQPKINYVYNNSETITGSINDDDATIIAIVDDNVYVSKDGGKERYKAATDLYDENKNIIETDITVMDNRYSIDIPYLDTGESIYVYNIDHLNRISRENGTKVAELGPNLPMVYQVSNIERNVLGKVTSTTKNTIFNVYVEVNGRVYTGRTSKNGLFNISINEQLQSGQEIYVYATDESLGKVRKSGIKKVTVDDIDKLKESSSEVLTIDGLTNKENYITGRYQKGNEKVYIAISTKIGKTMSNQIYEVTTDAGGEFSLLLDNSLDAGTKIYAMTRFLDGPILAISSTEVIRTNPAKPSVLEPINNSQKVVYVVTDENCEVTVQIGKTKYSSKTYEYNKELKAYVYAVEVGRSNSSAITKVYAKNEVGYSKVLQGEVVKLAPDSPQVNKVTSSDKEITGSIELIGKNSDTTKVYAKVGTKTYAGTIDNEGNFTINIKNQKASTSIYVWGEQDGNRGPLTESKVVAK
jgi:2',3'-cyclic-nucleotide 2'-phosphodiesterase/3'-nucleotidase/5'-nucleotidase